MSDDDSAIVELLEQVITKTVSREEFESTDSVEKQTNGSGSPLSLDYGDSDEPDNFKENQEVENSNSDSDQAVNGSRTELNGFPRISGLSSSDSGDIDMTEDIGEPLEYVVEDIVAKRENSVTGLPEYFVKWKNFPSSSNTWEPPGNLSDCDKIMEAFEFKSARKLAQKRKSESDEQSQARKSSNAKNKQDTQLKEYEVNDIMGLTTVQGENYFLVSLSNTTQKTFIRAKLANRIVPDKVIDFYIKSIKWKIV